VKVIYPFTSLFQYSFITIICCFNASKFSGVGCSLAAVLGSAGPDGLYDPSGNDADNSDDIIKIIAR
jgi:hypothetical protein